jgi:hypothetical protein
VPSELGIGLPGGVSPLVIGASSGIELSTGAMSTGRALLV